jgi:hypothetical protein
MDWTVDLAWSCAQPTATEDIAPAQGYVLTPSQLGCPGAVPQKLVVRPLLDLSPPSMVVMPYGTVSHPYPIALTQTPSGYTFSDALGPLAFAGTLVSHSPNTGAVVALSSATWRGSSACTPGTYTFAPEQ